ncbi:17792_t:CDS:2, partial [Acaulospora morrowiae]
TQLREINKQGTEEEKKNAIRLESQFNLPMEIRLRMVMDFASAETGINRQFMVEYRLVALAIMFKKRPKRDYRLHEQPSVEEETSAIPTKRTKLDEKFNATKSSSELLPSTNVQQTSNIPNSNDVKTKELEADEEIKFDLVNVSMELNREPTVKWEVGCIRFWQYQKDVFQKVSFVINYGALLAMSVPHRTPLPPEISSSLRDTASKQLVGGDVFMDCGNAGLNRMIALMFNDLYYNIPEVVPSKLSEEEHCDMFIYPITRSFRGSEKEYELRLNRANAGSKTRPDLSCIVNDVPILNPDFKPLDCTPLQRKRID